VGTYGRVRRAAHRCTLPSSHSSIFRIGRGILVVAGAEPSRAALVRKDAPADGRVAAAVVMVLILQRLRTGRPLLGE
jgi:hypothetical protein